MGGDSENQEKTASGQENAQNQGDAASTGSQGEQGEVIQVTKAEYEKMQNDFKSMVGRMKGVGTLEAELAQARAALGDGEQRMSALQAQLDALEDERMSGKSPDIQVLLKERRELRAKASTLQAENTQLQKKTGKLVELERTQTAMRVAAEEGVTLESISDFVDLPEDKLRKLAQSLKASGKGGAAGSEGTPTKKGMAGDSLAGKGAPNMSDADFLRKYASGELPDTPAIHKKAVALQQAQGINVGR